MVPRLAVTHCMLLVAFWGEEKGIWLPLDGDSYPGWCSQGLWSANLSGEGVSRSQSLGSILASSFPFPFPGAAPRGSEPSGEGL